MTSRSLGSASASTGSDGRKPAQRSGGRGDRSWGSVLGRGRFFARLSHASIFCPRAAVIMGREFGNLARIRHVISYSLSPFEQRAFPSYFSKGIPNVLRRTRERILRVAPREYGAGGVQPRTSPSDALAGQTWRSSYHIEMTGLRSLG